MVAVIYYLFIKPISWLPFPIIYLLSDFMYPILYYVIRFRRNIVRGNLVRSFPGKNTREIRSIEKKFYRHLSDLFLESFKLFSVSEKQLRRRFVKRNPEVLNRLYETGKSVILVGGHYNNWEMAGTSFCFGLQHTILGIYNPFSNKFFDKKTMQSRSKFGLVLVSKYLTLRYMIKYKDRPTATLFVFDQSPPSDKNIYWIRFLNQDTAWFTGVEKYAKLFNYPVVYGHMIKEKRGFYSMEFEVVEEDVARIPDGYLTEKIVSILEREIRNQPEYWLWTHRRWKRTPEENHNAG